MNDRSLIEFYRDDDLLFMKWNGQIIEALSYKGGNEFSGGVASTTTAKFEPLPNQKITAAVHFYSVVDKIIKEFTLEGVKAFKY